MATLYPFPHWLLTVLGTAWGGAETWSWGLRLENGETPPEPTTAMTTAIAPLVSTFHGGAGASFRSTFRLTHIKLAPIGVNGKYPDGQDAVEHVYPTPIDGYGTAGEPWPPQCAYVVTLMGERDRGLAQKGRVYLPQLQGTIGTDGRLPDARRDQVVAAFKTFVNGLNALTETNQAQVTIMSGRSVKGPGAALVTRLRGGLVVDTQRRRRRQLDEGYEVVAL